MTQIRVHELGTELGVDPQQVMDFLAADGKKVRGRSAVVGASAAAQVRRHFRASVSPVAATLPAQPTAPVRAPAAASVADSTAAPVQTPKSAPAAVLSAVPVAASIGQSLFSGAPAAFATTHSNRVHGNPFQVLPQAQNLEQFDPERARVLVSTVPTVQTTPTAAAPLPRAESPKAALFNFAAPDLADDEPSEEPDYREMWQQRNFDADEQESWIAGGLRENEADVADRCRVAGITPDSLRLKLSGRTTLQRVRDGESMTSVWARIQEAKEAQPRTGSRLTGRFRLS